MPKKLNTEEFIGQKFGCYEIISSENINGRTYFTGKCVYCGKERKTRISNFKKIKTESCPHQKEKRYCLQCGKEIKNPKFCSQSCAAKYNKNRKNHNIRCLNCGKELKFPAKKFCSFSCQHEYSYNNYIEKWKNGEIDGTISTAPSNIIKNYIRKKYNNKCCKCGWSKINPTTSKIPLEIHHKYGNYKNNKEDNLELLCPNCHSLTSTYKALNCGQGRSDRYK